MMTEEEFRAFTRIVQKFGAAIFGQDRTPVLYALAGFARMCCHRWKVDPADFVEMFHAADPSREVACG